MAGKDADRLFASGPSSFPFPLLAPKHRRKKEKGMIRRICPLPFPSSSLSGELEGFWPALACRVFPFSPPPSIVLTLRREDHSQCSIPDHAAPGRCGPFPPPFPLQLEFKASKVVDAAGAGAASARLSPSDQGRETSTIPAMILSRPDRTRPLPSPSLEKPTAQISLPSLFFRLSHEQR